MNPRRLIGSVDLRRRLPVNQNRDPRRPPQFDGAVGIDADGRHAAQDVGERTGLILKIVLYVVAATIDRAPDPRIAHHCHGLDLGRALALRSRRRGARGRLSGSQDRGARRRQRNDRCAYPRRR